MTSPLISSEKRYGLRCGGAAIIACTLAAVVLFAVFGGKIQVDDPQPADFTRLSRCPNHTLVPEDRNSSAFVRPRLFSPDSRYLIADSWSDRGEYEVAVWDVKKKTKVNGTRMPRYIRSLSMTARGDLLAVAVGDPLDHAAKERKNDERPREVRLFSFPEMNLVGTIKSELFISQAVYSPDGKVLATIRQHDDTPNWELTVWDIGTGKPKYTIPDIVHRGRSGAKVRFSPDGKRFAHTNYRIPVVPGIKDPRSGQPAIAVYETDSGKLLEIICHDPNDPARTPMDDFTFFPDGKNILVKSDHLVRSCDLAGREFRTIYRSDNRIGTIQHAILSQDSKWLVLGIDNRYLRGAIPPPPSITIWDMEAKKVYDRWTLPGIGNAVTSMALSPDKKILALSGSGLHLYDLSPK